MSEEKSKGPLIIVKGKDNGEQRQILSAVLKDHYKNAEKIILGNGQVGNDLLNVRGE